MVRRCLRRAAVLVLVGLALSLPTPPAHACPNCKEAVSVQPAEAAGMARGYNFSVLFMVSMPFLLLGTGACLVARAVKRGALPEL